MKPSKTDERFEARRGRGTGDRGDRGEGEGRTAAHLQVVHRGHARFHLGRREAGEEGVHRDGGASARMCPRLGAVNRRRADRRRGVRCPFVCPRRGSGHGDPRAPRGSTSPPPSRDARGVPSDARLATSFVSRAAPRVPSSRPEDRRGEEGDSPRTHVSADRIANGQFSGLKPLAARSRA